jgi:hypothetical protein
MAAVVVGWTAATALPAFATLARPELVVEGPRGGTPFNAPEGIALNPKTGEIVLANTSDHYVEIYSPGGNLLTRFPHMVRTPEGNLIEGLPKGIAVLGNGRIVVADAFAPYVDIVDYRGHTIAELKTPVAAGAGGLSAVTVTREGGILAAGPGTDGAVYAFAADYSAQPPWGSAGRGPGHLSAITAIAERFEVSAHLVAAVEKCRMLGGRVIAVGTTVARGLESAAAGGKLIAGSGDTRLFITPNPLHIPVQRPAMSGTAGSSGISPSLSTAGSLDSSGSDRANTSGWRADGAASGSVVSGRACCW